MSQPLPIALGRQGVALNVPDGVDLKVARPVETSSGPPARHFLEVVADVLASPGEGPPLKELAAGKRRAVICVGDLSLPAPYELVLSSVAQVCVEAGIRPGRILFLTRPGYPDRMLGSQAIRRYGERTVGVYDLQPWMAEGGIPVTLDPLDEAADLRIAVGPLAPQAELLWTTPRPPEFALGIDPGHGAQAMVNVLVSGTAAHVASAAQTKAAAQNPPTGDALLLSGGGAPSDATLEEALRSLAGLGKDWSTARANFSTVALALSGHEGLGSSTFFNALHAALDQAEAGEIDAAIAALNAVLAPPQADTADRQWVIYAPALLETAEGEDLSARLEDIPALAERLILAGHEEVLWTALRARHGESYTLWAEPLGWRT